MYIEQSQYILPILLMIILHFTLLFYLISCSIISTYILRRIQVLDVVDVDITQQNQSLDMIRVILDQLIEERCRLEWSVVIGQQQRQVEQRTPKILL